MKTRRDADSMLAIALMTVVVAGAMMGQVQKMVAGQINPPQLIQQKQNPAVPEPGGRKFRVWKATNIVVLTTAPTNAPSVAITNAPRRNGLGEAILKRKQDERRRIDFIQTTNKMWKLYWQSATNPAAGRELREMKKLTGY